MSSQPLNDIFVSLESIISNLGKNERITIVGRGISKLYANNSGHIYLFMLINKAYYSKYFKLAVQGLLFNSSIDLITLNDIIDPRNSNVKVGKEIHVCMISTEDNVDVYSIPLRVGMIYMFNPIYYEDFDPNTVDGRMALNVLTIRNYNITSGLHNIRLKRLNISDNSTNIYSLKVPSIETIYWY